METKRYETTKSAFNWHWVSINSANWLLLPLFINSPFLTFNWCLICSGCSPPPGGIRFMRKFKTLVRKPLNKRRRQEKTGVYQIILNVPLLTYIRFSKLSKKNGWAHTWAGLLKIQIHTYANISKGNKALKKKEKENLLIEHWANTQGQDSPKNR